ncbi:MAG: hypothetical protein AABX84_00080 [Nanoarchaeota archaeon]
MSSQVYKSLNEISCQYKLILIDSSALTRPIDAIDYSSKIEDKIIATKRNYDSAIFFGEFMKNNNNLYTTSNMLTEFLRGSNYHFKSKLKVHQKDEKKRRISGVKNDNLILNLIRLRNKECKARRSLVDFFEQNGKIIDLDKSEKEEVYPYFQEKIKKNYPLTTASLDFLVLGATISINRGNIELITSSPKLIKSWADLVIKEDTLTSQTFRLFIREDLDRFKMILLQ